MSTEQARVGNWMQTFSGKAFYPLDPRVEEIDDWDIAHSLAMQCRYNGHTSKFYSVAEHCVILSHYVTPENALAALLHDAAEACVGDMVRPLKQLMPAFVEAEDRILEVIAAKYGVEGPICNEEVKEADLRILQDERAVLLESEPMSWDLDGIKPLGVTFNFWSPNVAQTKYLIRLFELIRENENG